MGTNFVLLKVYEMAAWKDTQIVEPNLPQPEFFARRIVAAKKEKAAGIKPGPSHHFEHLS